MSNYTPYIFDYCDAVYALDSYESCDPESSVDAWLQSERSLAVRPFGATTADVFETIDSFIDGIDAALQQGSTKNELLRSWYGEDDY